MVSRRSFLRASVPLTAAVAGCGATSNDDEPTSTPATTTVSPPSLSFFAEVTHQADDQQPLTVQVGVENRSDRQVRLAPGGRSRPFQDIDRFQGPAELVLLPVEGYGVDSMELRESPVEGCWRFVDVEGEPVAKAAISTSVPTEIDAGYRYSVRHRVYQVADSGPCLPPGSYRGGHTLYVGYRRSDQEFPVEFVLTIDEGGTASMRAVSE
jgi:hypothetical protein